ncbi:MAG: hypothetical protein U0802_06635 [Candidatus Binatia bacterium]
MRRALLVLVLLAAAPARGQVCPGDCSGDGAVRVEELIVGVRIALGESAVAACPVADANGDGAVTVDELVRAVTSALSGCPASPTPTDTPSPSPTATDTATPTATPTIPPVAGSWVEAVLAVDASSCAAPLTAAFSDELATRGPCRQQVELTGETSVRVADCSRQVVDGTLDRDGTMHLAFPPSEGAVADCTVTIATSSVIPAGAAAVIARYTFALAFGGEACPLEDCTIAASGAWTRME